MKSRGGNGFWFIIFCLVLGLMGWAGMLNPMITWASTHQAGITFVLVGFAAVIFLFGMLSLSWRK